MKRIYSRRKYVGEVRKLKKCERISKKVWEGNKWERSVRSREKKGKRKEEGDRVKVKSRGRGFQEEWVTRKVYSKYFIWIRW